MTSRFEQSIITYAKLHPEDSLSKYVLENYAAARKRKQEAYRKWKLISTALIHYDDEELDR